MQFTIQFNGKQVLIRKEKQLFYKGRADRTFRSTLRDSFLIHNVQNTPEITVNQYKGFLRASYDIISYQPIRKVFSMTSKSVFKGYWIIEDEADLYEIISHRRDKLSFYKNGVQVAAIPQYRSDTRTALLSLDGSENVNLFLGIAIAFFGSYYRSDNADFFLGHIGPEKKKYHPQWRAKS